jgi:rare lipoprotein A (peptidoglycan hydrolase)
MKIIKFLLKSSLIFLVLLIFKVSPVSAESYSLYLDQNTVERGYTIKAFDQEIILAIWPHIFNQPVRAQIEKIDPEDVTLPSSKKLLSPIFKITLTSASELQGYYTLVIRNQDSLLFPELYIKQTDTWERISSLKLTDNQLRTKLENKTVTIAAFGSLGEAQKPSYSLLLDQKTVQRGYTISYKDLTLAVWPNIFKKEVKVEIYELSSVILTNYQSLTTPYRIKIKTEEQIKDIPLTLILHLPRSTSQAVLVSQIEGNDWQEDSFYEVLGEGTHLRSYFKSLDFKVMGVEKENSLKGTASWYSSSVKYGAAINDYPLGTRLRVTNLANGKSITVEVVSHGLIAPDRIIDLTSSAFAQLAPLSVGLIQVEIEKL